MAGDIGFAAADATGDGAVKSAMNLADVWVQAEAEFPADGRFGIEVTRHNAGFYIGQISKRWVDKVGDDGPFHILGYHTGDTAAESLAGAMIEAHRSLKLGIDWMRQDLPKAA